MMRICKAAIMVALLVASAGQALASEVCRNSLDVSVGLEARLVTLPDAPSFVARGEGTVCYEIEADGATILGSSVPRLVFHGGDLPGGQGEMSAIVEVMPGVDPRVDWSHMPDVKVHNVDLRVRVYEGGPAAIDEGARPLVDVILPRIAFSTGLIDVQGWESFGHLDADALTALVVGEVTLPAHSYPPYQEWLAGEPVLLELTVQIRNPYSKGL